MNDIYRSKKYVTNSIYIKKALELNLSLEEFIMLTYFDNDCDGYLDMEKLCFNTGINIEEAYKIFNSLISKKLITIATEKDSENRMTEKVVLNYFYSMLMEEKNVSEKEQKKTDIYAIFESEFGRTISSMEYEIINAWLEKGFCEELIIGALKEAVYNGVNNLRYIDKILYEWNKKGFKKMADVNSHITKKEEKKDNHELFDYNWLEDEE